jgi:ubiquitin-conjugating enzyme E2 O
LYSIQKVKLSDRSLMPGDVVRRLVAGKDTQRGYCRSVRVSADVQVMGSKKVIPGVLASNLTPIQVEFFLLTIAFRT